MFRLMNWSQPQAKWNINGNAVVRLSMQTPLGLTKDGSARTGQAAGLRARKGGHLLYHRASAHEEELANIAAYGW